MQLLVMNLYTVCVNQNVPSLLWVRNHFSNSNYIGIKTMISQKTINVNSENLDTILNLYVSRMPVGSVVSVVNGRDRLDISAVSDEKVVATLNGKENNMPKTYESFEPKELMYGFIDSRSSISVIEEHYGLLLDSVANNLEIVEFIAAYSHADENIKDVNKANTAMVIKAGIKHLLDNKRMTLSFTGKGCKTLGCPCGFVGETTEVVFENLRFSYVNSCTHKSGEVKHLYRAGDVLDGAFLDAAFNLN